MPTQLLRSLHVPLAEEVAGLHIADKGLRGELDLRYGLVPFEIDYESEAEALRISVRIAMPPAAGSDFLVWCLSQNAQYWDAKIGLDDNGMVLVHADLDANEHTDLDELRTRIVDRIDTMAELIDDDLCEYLLERRLGTPQQLARWAKEQRS